MSMLIISNNKGLGLVQVMVAGSLLIGLGVYVTRSMQGQEKVIKNVTTRLEAGKKANEFSDVLTESDTCVASLSALSDLTNAELTTIKNKDGVPVYTVGQQMQSGKIEKMVILDYTAGPGLRRHKSKLQIKLRYASADVASNSRFFGGQTRNFDIPLYIVTKDNAVKVCMSDSSEIIEDALTVACNQFGGTMDGSTGVCKGIIGQDGLIIKYVRDFFCDSTGAGCPHGHSGKVCSGVDVRGVSHDNWVVSGFNNSGEIECTCVPRVCPNPANYCLGTDLGTDYCSLNCPQGTLSPGDYVPTADNVCSGINFVQTNSCGQTSMATGSKNCSS
jgi:hypothetical protein